MGYLAPMTRNSIRDGFGGYVGEGTARSRENGMWLGAERKLREGAAEKLDYDLVDTRRPGLSRLASASQACGDTSGQDSAV